jgi:rubrerythrin
MKHFNLSYVAAAALCALAAGAAVQAAELSQETLRNLNTAMHGEAYAAFKYRAYAEVARKRGNEALARLFEESANVEANEHFAREADASGLVSFDARNLGEAMAGEYQENTKMYVGFADAAQKAGDKKVAAMFRQIAADEGDHFQKFKEALVNLKNPPNANISEEQRHESEHR